MLRISRAPLTRARLTDVIENNNADQFEIDLISGDYLRALKKEYNQLNTLAFTPGEEVSRWKELLSEFRIALEIILDQHRQILIHQIDEFTFFLIKTIVAANGYDAREKIIYPGIMVRAPKIIEMDPAPIEVENPTPTLISIAAPLQRSSSISTNTSSQSSDIELDCSPRCSPTPNDEIEMTSKQLQELTSQLSKYEKTRQETLITRESYQKELVFVSQSIQALYVNLLLERVLKPRYWLDSVDAKTADEAEDSAIIVLPSAPLLQPREDTAYPAEKLEAKEEPEKFHRPLVLFTQNPCAIAIARKEQIYRQCDNKKSIRKVLTASNNLIEGLTKSIESLSAKVLLLKLQIIENEKPKSPIADGKQFLFFQSSPMTQSTDEKEPKRQCLGGPRHA